MSGSTFLVYTLICGGISAAIARRKNHPPLSAFVFGALFGIIGIIIVMFWKPVLPTAPEGMRAVKCPRCSLVQNIPEAAPEYNCWQCQAQVIDDGEGGKFLLQGEPAAQPTVVNVRCYHCQHVQAAWSNQSSDVCEVCGATTQRKS